ncbi:uncharacterized protein LOC129762728 [Toxorhynchites rutilus septentrionalis]|uniref:uncharacterized protein LOC129762728 n=1 Tax=Toxorhynchites rutilus septentrionalis TaxID=329112 RepID=UPI00247AF9BD|nr:uncharacterized protein LOC129762728 [Toxorhynchites rutilus septentrionalis]XP_055617221.1 uncharacterized protein LOC129762728 [Toxorhynchites rutilus septentrionalis]
METEEGTALLSENELVPGVWTDVTKGLRKERISFRFMSMTKPSYLSRCLITITNISGLSGRKSNILKPREEIVEQWIEIGTGITPVDCYIELFLIQMLTNETSKCVISCKNCEISFILNLLRIEDHGYYHDKSPEQMLTLAKQYKENGVKMFPEYTLFAHRYFNLASKCLLACSPLEDLEPLEKKHDTTREMQSLLEVLYLNISACLIRQCRYDEVLHVLGYLEKVEKPLDKAIYRKASAQFHIKLYKEAISTLERIDYTTNKDCMALYQRIKIAKQQEDIKYSNMVKKMFVG